MGNLLKVLTREIENYPHFFLDFESKSGTGVERMEKGWMEKEEGGVLTASALSFFISGTDEASEDSASVPLRCTFWTI